MEWECYRYFVFVQSREKGKEEYDEEPKMHVCFSLEEVADILKMYGEKNQKTSSGLYCLPVEIKDVIEQSIRSAIKNEDRRSIKSWLGGYLVTVARIKK